MLGILRRSVLPKLVTLTALSVVIAGVSVPLAPVPANAATPSATIVTERPDSVSAMVSARAIGQRVEDVSQRDGFSRVYANPDSTWTAETGSDPTETQDATGEWHPIDTTLVKVDAGGYAPAHAASDVVLSGGGDKVFAELTEDGHILDYKWPTILPTPVIEGDAATYPDVVPNGDLVVVATPTGFSHSIVLREAPSGSVNYSIPVATHGADLVETPSGGIAIKGGAGGSIVEAPRPVMWDSSRGAAGQPAVAAVGATAGETLTGTPELRLTPDQDFLQNPGTVYPVTIDPSFTIYNTGDTWIQNVDYTSSQGGSPELRVGSNLSGAARAFLRFGTNLWSGKHIISADLKLRNFYSGSCTAGSIRADRIKDDWTLSGLTWGNQPVINTTYEATFSAAYGRSAACPAGDASFDVRNMVQDWASGNYQNNGIRLSASSESNPNSERRYRSSEYTNYTGTTQPKISVTYNSYPNDAGLPSLSSGNPGYSTSLTPTISASLSDPDGGNVRATFEVYQGSTLKWSGTSPYVASGNRAKVSVAAGVLVNGGAYTVRARANDGTDNSQGNAVSTAFAVDTTKPAATVSATAFTNAQWATIAPSSNVFNFNGPSDTKSFAYTLDGVTQATKTADANGDANVSWVPKNGSHTVTVTPTDKAGNAGTTAVFTFGVGLASFTNPSVSARSTGVFPIQVTAPPSATGATLAWRYAGQTSADWSELTGLVTTDRQAWDSSNIATIDGFSSTPPLLWDATGQLDPASTPDPQATVTAPALLELRTCFTYASGANQVCSDPRQVQLVPSAFGGHFPVTSVGPASVALFTGEMTLSEPDAVDSTAGVGRTFATFDPATATPGAFGPGWSTSLLAAGESDATLVDNRARDRTIVLVTTGGASQTFTPLNPTVDPAISTEPVDFSPAGIDDGSRMRLDGTTVVLTRPQGAVTTWQMDTSGAWVLTKAASINANAEYPEATFKFEQPGYPTWIAQTEPGISTTCTETVQEVGCRGLKITYTGSGTSRRIATVQRLTGDANPLTLATYSYTNGLLTTVCGIDPDPADTTVEPLCGHYSYVIAGGRTLLASESPPGEQPWQFTYDASGRLTKVTRALDSHTNSVSGPAAWTLAYDLNPTSTGLPDITASAAADWGQTTIPTRMFAVFNPSHVPAATPTSSDLAYARLWYTDADGTTMNTAVEGAGQWLIDTSWYDQHDNVIRTLDGASRARALAGDPADRVDVAYKASMLTFYDDGDGRRVEDEFGPVHTATLEDGTTGPFRAHTSYTYDDENTALGGGAKPALPNGDTSFDLVVETRHSAADPDLIGEFDPTVVRNDYNPVIAGDGNGWELGTPTQVRVQLADGSWSTSVTRYDTEGHQIETRQPGDSQAGSNAHATTTSYYEPTASGATDPDCTTTGHPDRADWVGMPCKTGPTAQPTGPAMPITYQAAYSDDLQPTRIQETSGATTRVTTITYDLLGRTLSTTITDGSDTRTSTTRYDPISGLPTAQSGNGTTIATTYDTWGRKRIYTDATGQTSATTYTADGQTATFDDGVGTYTYSYDGGSGEHRRVLTNVEVGLGSGTPRTFTLAYDARGSKTSVAYPNGLTANYGYDDVGAPTSLQYTNPGTGGAASSTLLSFTANTDIDGRAIGYISTSSKQDYTYDNLGRLITVQDTRNNQCATRSYGFSPASERVKSASYAPAGDGTCQTATPSSVKANSYDNANRIRNSGYSYDNLGRTLTTPASDTAPGATGALTSTYYANDMIKSLTQPVDNGNGGSIVKAANYSLDAASRINAVSNTTAGAETSRLRYGFSDGSDAPTSVQTSTDSGGSYATIRYITIPGLGMAATASNGSLTYQLANLHDDVVATQADQSGQLVIDSYQETDEFGNAALAGATRYTWLGRHQRSSDTVGGLVLMGARVYNPSSGLFLSPDPVIGGNLTAYGYPEDPVNSLDLTGMYRSCGFWCGIFTNSAKILAIGGCSVSGFATWVCSAVVIGIIDVFRYIYQYNNGAWTIRGVIYTFLRTAGSVLLTAAITYGIARMAARILMRFGYARSAQSVYSAITTFYWGKHR